MENEGRPTDDGKGKVEPANQRGDKSNGNGEESKVIWFL